MYLYDIAKPSTRTIPAICTDATRRLLDLIQAANGTTGNEPTDYEVLATGEQRLIEIYEARRGAQGQLLTIGFGVHKTKLMINRVRRVALAALESTTLVDGVCAINLVARPARKWSRTKNSPPIDVAALEDTITIERIEELMLVAWMVSAGLDPDDVWRLVQVCSMFADNNISMAASDIEDFDIKPPMFYKDPVGADIGTVLMTRAAQHAARAVRGIQLAGI